MGSGATALSQEPVVGPALLPVRGSKRLAQGGTRTACPVWADRQGRVPGQLCRAVAPGECHLAGAKQQQHGKGREWENQQRLFTGVVTGFGLCCVEFMLTNCQAQWTSQQSYIPWFCVLLPIHRYFVRPGDVGKPVCAKVEIPKCRPASTGCHPRP